MGGILNGIDFPEDLKKLTFEQLDELCGEIRKLIIDTVSSNGGHLASNLGTVELTVALLKAFGSPDDKIVWDVGHQAYTYKILTGRKDRIPTIRTEGGLSGFPNRSESAYDPLSTGHSSTSISAALGIAEAKQLSGEKGSVVAVIGDGALTGGLAYEGLNNAGRFKKNFIVILNDNKMSISRNVGSMARYLAHIRTKPSYFKIKGGIENTVKRIPVIGAQLNRSTLKFKSALKQAMYGNTIFEDMGFYYYGPFDGHDIRRLTEVFNNVKNIEHPVLLHVLTQKGRGYSFAEKNPGAFHGVPEFNVQTGKALKKGSATFSAVFGKYLCTLAESDGRICAVTAAMKSGTGLECFAHMFPKRFFDVGIEEEHALTFSGGLAAGGMVPVFAVYSSFLQRGYDQMIHDISIQNVKVVLAVDRAGIVGEDGVTHQGLFDAALLNTVPGAVVFSPSYYDELKFYMKQAIYGCSGLAAVRYPRGGEPERPADFYSAYGSFDFYGRDNTRVIAITYGRLFACACTARKILLPKGINLSIIKLNRIVPIDKDAVKAVLTAEKVFFFEEGIESGGIGEHFGFMLEEAGFKGKYFLKAIKGFVAHAKMERALGKLGLDGNGMAMMILTECCK